MAITTCTIGFPRIGKNREMKKALESFWKGDSRLEELLATAAEVEAAAWRLQADAGVALVGLDGTLYDQVLDWVFLLGLAPPRFKALSGYAQYFAMARGAEGAPALDMSKFFDTNYHYMVPELDADSVPQPDFTTFLAKVKRGQEAIGKAKAVPIIIGPNTLVGLGRLSGVSRAAMVARLVPAYVNLLRQLAALGVPEVQMHEPILATSDAAALKDDFEAVYGELAGAGVALHLVTYYDDIGDAYPWVVQLPVQAISLDFLGVPGSAAGCDTAALVARHGWPPGKRLGAGVVDGRSVWADGGSAAALLAPLLEQGVADIAVTSSASLAHLPYDVALETGLPADLRARLAFATQKLHDIVQTAAAAAGDIDAAASKAPAPAAPALQVERAMFDRPAPYAERRPLQCQGPAFPTSTIGSFPQTAEIRRARLQYKKGALSEEQYTKEVDDYMAYAMKVQEEIGIDVLVHGEPERTDMVEYFGMKLEGFAFTEHGWVQSYGSRYVRPPIVHADVARRAPMTLREFQVAQALSKKPVKGMLTGPVTILNWSFPRKDLTRQAQAFQVALALRGEVADLEVAGCTIIQVDEPALREGLPLKRGRWDSYLAWATDAFRLACGVAAPATQVVTHLCYSDFQDILPAIDRLDADVLTIENSRSGNEMIAELAKFGYSRDIGPGVYDVHSPVVPSVDTLAAKIRSFLATGVLAGHPDRLWVVPDCGLKTRAWAEVLPSLRNMVEAAARVRAELGANGAA